MLSIDEQYRRLVESLMLLAAPADVQLKSFPAFASRVDEIALTFDESFRYVPALENAGRLDPSQAHALGNINERLTLMSSTADPAAWEETSLFSNQDWQWLRDRAADLLSFLHLTPREPVLDWMFFTQ